MNIYFSPESLSKSFHLFSTEHLATLLILFLVNIIVILFLKKKDHTFLNKYFCFLLAMFLLLLEASAHVWRLFYGKWALNTSLPLHLCGVSVFISAYMLIKKQTLIYEIAYFWGLGGAVMALITPNLEYNFPHFLFIKFFITHSCIVTAVLYMTIIEGFRPAVKSIWKVFLITNLYMIIIAFINMSIDSNYLYICHKPGNKSLLDYIGPWPYYIIGIEILGIVFSFLYHLPFVLIKNSPDN